MGDPQWMKLALNVVTIKISTGLVLLSDPNCSPRSFGARLCGQYLPLVLPSATYLPIPQPHTFGIVYHSSSRAVWILKQCYQMQAFLGMAIIKNSRRLMMVWGVEVFSHKEHFYGRWRLLHARCGWYCRYNIILRRILSSQSMIKRLNKLPWMVQDLCVIFSHFVL